MNNQEVYSQAAAIVRSGGVVIVLTETFYALAADPFQGQAIGRIFTIKQRALDKPLPLIAANLDAVRRVVRNPGPAAQLLMNRFWPGSLTILLEPGKKVSELLTGSYGKIGVRVPPPCAARTLAERADGWLTATSANLSGDPNPDTIGRIAPRVRGAVDLIVDHGTAPGGEPSTVVEPLESGVRIIRQGAIAADTLTEFVSREFARKSS